MSTKMKVHYRREEAGTQGKLLVNDFIYERTVTDEVKEQRKRRGHIKVSCSIEVNILIDAFTAIRFLPLAMSYDYMTNTRTYTGYSHNFEKCADFSLDLPVYLIVITRDENEECTYSLEKAE